ncbi:MAG: ImmA/IrrE family metallo-endopeptidase [Firmicutes bacterium]|nr:ImmA/IrrE family metallo-endopeptidase [Bacillota bacterium]
MKEKIELNSDAIKLRKEFGEDPYAPLDIFSILNNREDLTVVFYPMSERISGISIRDGDIKLMAVNSTLTYGRQRFTAAHELCHLYFHENYSSNICGKDIDKNYDAKEKEADMFASYFLAPLESLNDFIKTKLKKEKNHLDVHDVIRIEQHYGLSRQATLWRLKNDGYLPFKDAETMKTGIISGALKLGFDIKLYLPAPQERQYHTLGRYIKLAEELREKALISNGKYEELLLNAFRGDIVYGLDSEGTGNYD